MAIGADSYGGVPSGSTIAVAFMPMRTMVMAVCAVVLAGCGGGSDGAAATTTTSSTEAPTTTVEQTTTTEVPNRIIAGTFSLSDSDLAGGDWENCHGTGGYDDFGPGMNVTVRDGDGNIVGSGSTVSMTQADSTAYPDDYALWKKYPTVYCVVKLRVEVKDAEFYAIKVGSRGELSYSKDDLDAMNWQVELSLG